MLQLSHGQAGIDFLKVILVPERLKHNKWMWSSSSTFLSWFLYISPGPVAMSDIMAGMDGRQLFMQALKRVNNICFTPLLSPGPPHTPILVV